MKTISRTKAILIFVIISSIKNLISASDLNRSSETSLNSSECTPKFGKGTNEVFGDETPDKIDIKKFPFLASYGYFEKPQLETWKHVCSAAIISERALMTAAHCLRSNDMVNNTQKVMLGQSDLNAQTWSTTRQEIDVKEVKTHQKYDGSSAYFDVGIIFTKQAIAFNDAIRPICLPSEPFEYDQLLKKHCGMGGWGQHKSDKVELDFRDLQINGKDVCDKKYDIQGESTIAQNRKTMLPNLFTEQTFCAVSKYLDIGSCKGDSGAPMVEYLEHHSQQFMVAYGVVHGCLKKCCTNDYPTVFTNLGDKEVLDFVRNYGIPIDIKSMSTKDEELPKVVYIGILIGLSLLLIICVVILLCVRTSRRARRKILRSATIKVEENEPLQPQNTEGNETLQSQNAEGRDSLHSQKVWYCQWNKLRESIQSSDAHIIAAEVDEIMNNDTLQPLEEDILVNDATNSKQDELVKPPEVKDLENATKVEENNEHLQPLKYDILVHDLTKKEQDKLVQPMEGKDLEHPIKVDTTEIGQNILSQTSENINLVDIKVDSADIEHDMLSQTSENVNQEDTIGVQEDTECEENEDLPPSEDVDSENSIVMIDQNEVLQSHADLDQVKNNFENEYQQDMQSDQRGFFSINDH